VNVPLYLAPKLALYLAMSEAGCEIQELAKRLGISETVVRRCLTQSTTLSPRDSGRLSALAADRVKFEDAGNGSSKGPADDVSGNPHIVPNPVFDDKTWIVWANRANPRWNFSTCRQPQCRQTSLRNQLQTELIADGLCEARAVREIGGLFSYTLAGQSIRVQ